MSLSGIQWVSQFPTSTNISDLVDPFRAKAQSFIDALKAAGASVVISATLRPPQRASLMYYAYKIANGSLDPTDPNQVPPIPGVDIQWVHLDSTGQPDIPASQAAAQEMVQRYDIVHQPASPASLSRHTQGLAVDMTISWQSNLSIVDGNGVQQTITSIPRDGAGNADLHHVGLSYGVVKLLTDPPHWSSDGH